MLALGCHETAPDIDSAVIGKRMFWASVRACSSPLLPKPVKANVLFFNMFVKTLSSKMYPRAGVAADGEKWVVSRPVKQAQTFPRKSLFFFSHVSFARVIFLTGAPGNLLHTAGNNV